MDKTLIRASLVRAFRSFLQAIVAQVPAGFVVTPAMIQYFKIGYLYVVLAILINALIYAAVSFATCMIGGLPEVEAGELLGTGIQTLYEAYPDEFEETEEEESEVQ